MLTANDPLACGVEQLLGLLPTASKWEPFRDVQWLSVLGIKLCEAGGCVSCHWLVSMSRCCLT